MSYISSRQEAYRHPRSVMEGVKYIVMLGMNYYSVPAEKTTPGKGRVARYAWGAADYHDLIHARLKQIRKTVLEWIPDAQARGVVDTAPLLEREFAQLAGIGWRAKNTMLINRDHGSWFFLAALLLDCDVECDPPFEFNHCGTCTACLDACPTDAFVEPHVLDATKCISYLTIEHRSAIPIGIRAQIGDWLFGCDVCQDVCPWNRKATPSREEEFQPSLGMNPIELTRLFELTDEGFRQRFRKTPLWRSKRRGILRNAATVLGNQPSKNNLDALEKGLNDDESLVRGASAWALGKHHFANVRKLLETRFPVENDSEVREEITRALAELSA